MKKISKFLENYDIYSFEQGKEYFLIGDKILKDWELYNDFYSSIESLDLENLRKLVKKVDLKSEKRSFVHPDRFTDGKRGEDLFFHGNNAINSAINLFLVNSDKKNFEIKKEILSILIRNMESLNVETSYGTTPLMALISRNTYQEYNFSRIDELIYILDYLIYKGSDINYKNKYGVNALLHSCLAFRPDWFKELIKGGSDTNVESTDGTTINSHLEKFKGIIVRTEKLFVKYDGTKSIIGGRLMIGSYPDSFMGANILEVNNAKKYYNSFMISLGGNEDKLFKDIKIL